MFDTILAISYVQLPASVDAECTDLESGCLVNFLLIPLGFIPSTHTHKKNVLNTPQPHPTPTPAAIKTKSVLRQSSFQWAKEKRLITCGELCDPVIIKN